MPRSVHAAGVLLLSCGGLFLRPSPIAAGSSDIELECKSIPRARDQLTIKGWVPGDGLTLDLSLSSKGSTMTFKDSNGESVAVVNALDHKVFTLTVMSKGGTPKLILYAIPGSMKKYRSKKGTGVGATFRAVLALGLHPWKQSEHYYADTFRDVRLDCEYDFSI
jgi:hypothetical protein